MNKDHFEQDLLVIFFHGLRNEWVLMAGGEEEWATEKGRYEATAPVREIIKLWVTCESKVVLHEQWEIVEARSLPFISEY